MEGEEEVITQAAEPSGAPEASEVAPAAAAPAPAAPAPHAEPKKAQMIPLAVFQDRLATENRRVQEAERRAADAEALARRLAGEKTPPAVTETPAPAISDQEIARRVAAQRLWEETSAVKDRGLAAYGASFNEVVNILNVMGAATDSFLNDVIATDRDRAHEMLKTLSEQPERLGALAQMSSPRRIAELTRMSLAAAAPKSEPAVPAEAPKAAAPKAISKAPPPSPRVEPSGSTAVAKYSDKLSDAEFRDQFYDNMKARAARRR